MKSQNDKKDRGAKAAPVNIEPISFRRQPKTGRLKLGGYLKGFFITTLAALLLLLCASAWFVLTARQVAIQIAPQPDQVFIRGGILTPKIGDYHLMRPGEYTLDATRECFARLQKRIVVTAGEKRQNFEFTMTKQPGKLSFQTHQANAPSTVIEGALINIEGKEKGRTPLVDLAVNPGRTNITARAENYQPLNTEIEVTGCGQLQEFDLALIPGWAEISLRSEPEGASVSVGGKSVGTTPLTLRLLEGEHDIDMRLDNFKPWNTRLAVVANQPQTLETIRMQPADGHLTIQTKPSGVNVILENTYAGQSPLKLSLAAGKTHLIHLSKAGYEKASREVKLLSQESKTLTVTLKPKVGTINFVVQPPDAKLFVDGKAMGTVPKNLRLVAVEHKLELKKPGYKPYQIRITPRPGFPQEINVALIKKSSGPKAPTGMLKAKNGYELKLIRPRSFTMGSSRREQGRRSNETLREIDLRRPFYMGIREVTNKEFRQFIAAHNSGAFKNRSLNRDELPVVQITWEQAALFCNWLSVRESLTPVYRSKNGSLLAADSVGTGYRLPTEAEWEYCARFNQSKADLKYPWGNKYPPTAKSGNFADESAKDLLPSYLRSYNDGYAISAPPGKFGPNRLGLFDMGGNAMEWCHDYYAIYPYKAGKVYADPMGPEKGRHHVVRGSSWMTSGISDLRLAYRNYSNTKRPDLGFRICRYAR